MPSQAKLRRTSTLLFSSQEQGHSIVVIALIMVGVIAMLGLVLDGGNSYLQRRRMQNSADGSAIAGVIKLANPGTLTGRSLECSIRYEIEKFATLNGVPGPTPVANCGTYNTNILANFIDSNGNAVGTYVGLHYGVPTTAKGISVTVATTFGAFFLGVIGMPNGSAAAEAKAAFAPLAAPSSIQPFAIPCSKAVFTDCFTKGDVKDIYEGSGSGNFGWLSWNGDSDAGYVANELNPSVNTLSGYIDPHGVCPNGGIAVSNGGTQCWMEGSSGVSNSSDIGAQMDAWIARGAAGTPMIIPVYDQCEPIDSKTGQCKTSGGGTNVNYRIKGFAAFILKSYNLSSKRVTGVFVNTAIPGKLCTSNCFDTGVYGIHLRP